MPRSVPSPLRELAADVSNRAAQICPDPEDRVKVRRVILRWLRDSWDGSSIVELTPLEAAAVADALARVELVIADAEEEERELWTDRQLRPEVTV